MVRTKKQKGKLKHNSNCNPIVFILTVFYTNLAKNEMKKHHTGVIYGNDKILACQNLEFSTIWNYCGIIYLPSNICNPRLSLILFNWYFPLRWNFKKNFDGGRSCKWILLGPWPTNFLDCALFRLYNNGRTFLQGKILLTKQKVEELAYCINYGNKS